MLLHIDVIILSDTVLSGCRNALGNIRNNSIFQQLCSDLPLKFILAVKNPENNLIDKCKKKRIKFFVVHLGSLVRSA